MKILDGKKLANKLNQELKLKIANLKSSKNYQPHLVVILIGKNEASKIYVKNKAIKAAEVGIKSTIIELDQKISEIEILSLIKKYNVDVNIDGILVQLPLPEHINEKMVIDNIIPIKDVDGFNIQNIGLLTLGEPLVIPCTPLGCFKILENCVNLEGSDIIIIGRSNIVGKPLSYLLTNKNATVTLAHSKTKNLKDKCKNYDVVVAAVGIPNLVKEDWLKNESIVIDVGINSIFKDGKRKIVGDVDFENVISKVKHITPVPGGIGPMTIHCLLNNTYELSVIRNKFKL